MTRVSLHARTIRRLGLLALGAGALAACTSGPDFSRPDKPTTDGYTPEKMALRTASAPVHGGEAQMLIMGADVPGRWWQLYNSPELDALIDQALRANPDLDAAQAALRRSNELLYAQQGALFPTFSGGASGSQQLYNAAQAGQAGTTSQFAVNSASLSVAYAPDLWGGVRRQVESQAALAEYQRFQLEAAYLTLTTNVVVAAVNLASLRAQIAATETIIRLQSEGLTLVQRQFDAGYASRPDVLAQQAALTQTQATLPPLQKQLAQQRNQLMTLLGKPPTDDAGQGLQLATLHLPQNLPVSLPSTLVEQRPDVRSAEARLHSASADIGVAVAAQLPQLNITGQLGVTSAGLGTLFGPGTALWSIGASIAQTLIDGGQLEHKKRAAVAAFDQAAAQYRSTVLSAFQDVANALRALQADADALTATTAAERTAQQSLALSQQQYALGTVNYLILLNAQQTYQTALVNRIKAQAARFSDTAALFQALGGGWWNRSDVAPGSLGKPDVFWLPPVQDVKLPRAGH
ncbi:MAG: efflux transporter outer membrane subunit [Pseudomonadota bacterium]